MPIRSSVCAYSPLAAASATGKYSSSGSSGASRYSCGSPSYGQYRPLASSATSSSYLTSTNNRYVPTSVTSSKSLGTTPMGSWCAKQASSYSPASIASSSGASSVSSSAASGGHYRPLSSAGVSSRRSSAVNTNGSAVVSPRSSYHTPASRYSSVSNSSLSSASSDYLSPGLTTSSSAASSRFANQTSSAYSSGSLSSASSLGSAGGRHYSPTTSYRRSSPRDLEQLPDDVPDGLVNLGNTCYMNASLQALFAVEPFRDALSKASSLLRVTGDSLTIKLFDLFNEMKRSPARRAASPVSSPINPTVFKRTFARQQTKFSGYEQQDAQEFLRYLINGVHEECNQAAAATGRRAAIHRRSVTSQQDAWQMYTEIVDRSPFVDVLVGQLDSRITCTQCHNESHCWDPFWDLSLPLCGPKSRYRFQCDLNELIDEFTQEETLDFDERPVCARCKQPTRSTKKIDLTLLPRVLILHLKKFTNDGYKRTSPDVKVETELNLTDQQVVYQLKACISHHGSSASSGHYTAHCEYSAKWFRFNDERVTDESQNFDAANLKDAYVLFYVRQSRRPVF